METGSKSIEPPVLEKFNQPMAGKRIAIEISYEGLCIIVAEPEQNKILEII